MNICKKCGTVIPPGSLFCVKCGTRADGFGGTNIKTCKKCGAVIASGSNFCGKCGEPADSTSVKTICPKCKNEVPDGFVFCDKCGHKISLIPKKDIGSDGKRTLTVKRDMQMTGAAMSYIVSVNGELIGNVSVGKSVEKAVDGDVAEVEISCASAMALTSSKVRLKLQLEGNPVVIFRIKWPGTILIAVSGAKILEQRNN